MHIVALSTQVYKWVPVTYYWGQPCNGLASHPGGGVAILSVTSCYKNWVKLRLMWAFGSCATTFFLKTKIIKYCSAVCEIKIHLPLVTLVLNGYHDC